MVKKQSNNGWTSTSPQTDQNKSFSKTLLLGSICQISGVVQICLLKKTYESCCRIRFLKGSYSPENQHIRWELTVAKWFVSFINDSFSGEICSIFGGAYCFLLISTTCWRVLDNSSLDGLKCWCFYSLKCLWVRLWGMFCAGLCLLESLRTLDGTWRWWFWNDAATTSDSRAKFGDKTNKSGGFKANSEKTSHTHSSLD